MQVFFGFLRRFVCRAPSARAHVFIFVFCILASSFLIPSAVFADTIVSSDISTDTTWTKEGSPYLLQGGLMIDQGATLSIEPGTLIQSDSYGNIDVFGQLTAAGTSADPVFFTSSGKNWGGINFFNPDAASSLDNVTLQHTDGIYDFASKDLSLSHITVKDARYALRADGSHLSLDTLSAENVSEDSMDIDFGSNVTMKNILLKNAGMGVQIYVNSHVDIANLLIDHARTEAVAVYVGSSVHIASSTITDVSQSAGAVEAFNNSSADISGLTLSRVSGGEAINVFNNSKMTLSDSTISDTNWYDAVGVFNAGFLSAKNVTFSNGTGDGVDFFNGGTVDMQDSVVSGFTNGLGVADYAGSPAYPVDTLSLTHTEIKNNATGIGLYSDNSVYAISNNSIHQNGAGLELYGAQAADVRGNYWGDPTGPENNPDNLTGVGNRIVALGSTVTFSPWLTSWGDPCGIPGSCVSNVLFLPGIEGSRLYEGTGCGATAEEKLWEPLADSKLDVLLGAGDAKTRKLFLDSTGESSCSDIYTKKDGVIDTVAGGDIYKGLIDELDRLKKDGTLNDWAAAPYDWRLSLDDLLAKGTETSGGINYGAATGTPYILQTLQRLAAGSKTGKVTIIAHSNGGLVAKALLQALGDEAAAKLVDRVIMVAVPQSGAPADVGATLLGYDAGIYSYGVTIVSNAVARALAYYSPMAYHLLPSAAYLASVGGDTNHPLVRFKGTAYAKEEAAYGETIGSIGALDNFLLAKEGGRERPPESDLRSAEVLNAPLLDYANRIHNTLDTWAPPAGIKIDQVAGWGVDTVAGVDFYTTRGARGSGPARKYRPIFTEDGDGTVPVPSALAMASTTNVKRYWLDLDSYYKATKIKRTHSDIFEVPSLRDFIKNSIENSTSTTAAYISSDRPSSLIENKKLIFYLHSPLTLQLSDSSGNTTGLSASGAVTQNIPGATYGQFGEVQYVSAPAGGSYMLALHGLDTGTFSLDVEESSGGEVTTSSTIENVPTTASTLASMTISNGIADASSLSVDENGDGSDTFVVTPVAGETVDYAPPAPKTELEPVSKAAPQQISYGSISVPFTAGVPAPLAATTVMATTTARTVNTTRPAVARALVATTRSEPAKIVATKPAQESRISAASSTAITPQTASVYDAVSQQSVFSKLTSAVYNGFHNFWLAFVKFF